MEALVIVHLSSLDSYVELYGRREAQKLSMRMVEAVMSFKGPVYVVDQGWPIDFPASRPRVDFKYWVQRKKHIEWIGFDDDREAWEFVLRDLSERLKNDGITKVVLGGVWHDPGLEMGCVTEALFYLGRHFDVEVGQEIVGCVPSERR